MSCSSPSTAWLGNPAIGTGRGSRVAVVVVWVHPSIEPLLVYDCIAKFFCKLGRVDAAAKDAEYLALGNIQHNVTDHLSGAPKLIAQSVPGIAQQKKGVFRA
jgi:hypothetical protein